MTRPISPPSTEKEVGRQAWQIQRQEFMPMAFRWRTPDIDDPAGDPPVPELEPGWTQPDPPLERFSYRLNSDGTLEFDGHLLADDISTSGTVVVILPDAPTDPDAFPEPSYRLDEHVDRVVPVTIDDGTTWLAGTVIVDNVTGELRIFFAPASAAGPSQVWHRISTTGLNEVHVQTGYTELTGYYIANTSTGWRYCKLFDLAATPDAATDVPDLVIGIPPVTAANIGFKNPVEFEDGLGFCLVTGIADLNADQVNIRDMAVNLFYR